MYENIGYPYNYGGQPINAGLPSSFIPRPALIPEKVADRIEEYRSRSTISTDDTIRLENVKTQNRILEEQNRFERERALLLIHDALDQRKQAETIDFFRKKSGDIYMIVERPDTSGITKMSVPTRIVEPTYLSIRALTCRDKGNLPDCIYVFWCEGDQKAGFFLAGDQINSDKFWQELNKKGIDVLATVRTEKSVRTKLFSWLMNEHSHDYWELDRNYGWVQDLDGKWQYSCSDSGISYIDAVLAGGGDFDD